ncbi:hypothetical protein PanWU01x14_257990 [Parasponia andersonii]|uniref:Uncharacterized protein n=1 Tax=Parasponia andersonii TaxID=3476 RepID=A0A2P5B9W0_PARAD|nr:hypothetical protein PanWU01x14_257990 [Parasponia andersonii]
MILKPLLPLYGVFGMKEIVCNTDLDAINQNDLREIAGRLPPEFQQARLKIDEYMGVRKVIRYCNGDVVDIFSRRLDFSPTPYIAKLLAMKEVPT